MYAYPQSTAGVCYKTAFIESIRENLFRVILFRKGSCHKHYRPPRGDSERRPPPALLRFRGAVKGDFPNNSLAEEAKNTTLPPPPPSDSSSKTSPTKAGKCFLCMLCVCESVVVCEVRDLIAPPVYNLVPPSNGCEALKKKFDEELGKHKQPEHLYAAKTGIPTAKAILAEGLEYKKRYIQVGEQVWLNGSLKGTVTAVRKEANGKMSALSTNSRWVQKISSDLCDLMIDGVGVLENIPVYHLYRADEKKWGDDYYNKHWKASCKQIKATHSKDA